MTNDDARCLLCQGHPAGRTYPFGTDWDGRRFDYLRCSDCRSSFLHPLPTDAEFARMYDRETYHDEYYAGAVEQDPDTSLPQIAAHLRAGGTLLDFGCGTGGFLRVAAREGYDGVGVELEESARRHAEASSGRPVFDLDTLFAEGRRFDVIHMGDVLEHLPDPAGMLRRLEGLLSPNGRYFIEGPLEDNAGAVFWAASAFGAAKRIMGKPLHGTLPPFHLFRTTARAQRDFFEERLGYATDCFLVFESGWPYWNEGDRLTRPRSAGHLLKMAIGRTGLALARATAPIGLKLGNRFAAVLTPKGRVSASS